MSRIASVGARVMQSIEVPGVGKGELSGGGAPLGRVHLK